jgi:dGTPase
MQYKTQVFINHEGDHYRNRLTHSIEVASIARSLSTTIGLSEDLSECVALAHDMGHTPFGHVGEVTLNECMKDYGGFCHNAHSIKLLTELEQRYCSYNGLNLTWEVLEGVAKHNGPIHSVPVSIAEYDAIVPLELDTYASAEAQIASLSDDIAYNCHDLEDAIRANLFEIHALEDIKFLAPIVQDITKRFEKMHKTRQIYEISRELAHVLINDLLFTTTNSIKQSNVHSAYEVRHLGRAIVMFSDSVLSGLQELKNFLFNRVYHHRDVVRVTYKCQKIVKFLFEIYFTNPDIMQFEWTPEQKKNEYLRARCIADYIAGMTDRYAIKEYNAIQRF